MTHHPLRSALLAVLAATAAPAMAQTPSTLEACAALEVDAARLSCYDALAGRGAADPAQADLAAERARAALDATEESGGRRGAGLFAHEDPPESALANAGRGSLLDSRWELARDSKLGLFNFRVYKPVYLMPVFWTSDVNDMPSSPNPENTVTSPQGLDALETKFQLSFKTKAVENLFGDNGDIWMGYTQSSRWQVFNAEQSRPFRETNYEPEVLLVFRNGYSLGGWNGRMAAIGINHQSNGRGDPLSRSWNRIMFNIGLDRDNWALMLRPWIRVSDGDDDDNPGMEDYIGRGDATLTYLRGRNEFSLMARHSLRGGDRSRGALQFDWGFPLHESLPMRGRLQVFHGYGESMIDYNHKATYVGLGISLQEWFAPRID
ncbi:phospholipase A [Luteimonas sp. SDU101]|uniref:phospholipase A n=1 Tax=Luteimonas sp. SDU101 TaxID=3422593 RepID=UPI003EBA08F0